MIAAALCMVALPLGQTGRQPLPVLVLVVSDGCAACRQVEPYAHLLARHGLLHVIDYAQHQDWCRQQGIRGVPHLIVWSRRGDDLRRADYVGSERIIEYARRQ